MTNPALDPFGKIPEFKYCAVAIKPGGDLLIARGYDTYGEEKTAEKINN